MTDPLKKPGQEAAAAPADALARLGALRVEITAVASTLLASVGGDDVTALSAVISLDEALRDAGALLRLIPDLVEIASPGQAISARLAARRDELERGRADLAAKRAALETAGELERQLAEVEAERGRLAERIGKLERLQQLAAELPALRSALAVAQEAASQPEADEADRTAANLTAAVRALAELTELQRSLTDAELSAMIERAEQATARAAATRAQRDAFAAELDRQVADAEELAKEGQAIVPSLELHRRADAELADGLDAAGVPAGATPLDRVRAALADVAERLATVDAKLKPLLLAHARAYEEARQIRNW